MEAASFGRTQGTVKEEYLRRRITFSRKFAHGPKRSISISTEISRNLGIMESILSVFQVTI